jgi:hypothetical protein
MWLRNAQDCVRLFDTGREKGVTSWSMAENVLATSYFGLPLTISLKDAIPIPSVLDESVSRICSPYEPISKGGFLS